METKTLPNAIQLEQVVLGALLVDYNSGVFSSVSKFLKAECFYDTRHAEVFKAIESLDKKRIPVDFLTVTEELKRASKIDFVGGAYFVTTLMNNVASSGSIEAHSAIIFQKFLLRGVYKLGQTLSNLSVEPSADCYNLIEIAQRQINSLLSLITKSNVQHMGDVIANTINDISKSITNPVKVDEGIKTGHSNVDEMFTKQKCDFGVIGARPGQGKTAYILSTAKHTALVLGKPVGIISLEMKAYKLAARLMASESFTPSNRIKPNLMNEIELRDLTGSVSQLMNAPIYVDDSPIQTAKELFNKVRLFVSEYKCEEIYVDYLQLATDENNKTREREIASLSRGLKLLANELGIVIIALSQLSRDVESRAGNKPQLSDLRESGAIEQDADWVQFLMRPETYGLGNEQGIYDGQTFKGQYLPVRNLMVLSTPKYRDGDPFVSALTFRGEFMWIGNYGDTLSQVKEVATHDFKSLQANDGFLNEESKF